MIDMQTSLPLLIVRPSILNPVMHFSSQPLTGEIKYPTNIPLPCAFHFISSDVDATHAPTRSTNDMIHFISSCDIIGSSILTSLALHHSLGPLAPSLAKASPPRGLSLQSLRLALHACNRSIKPSLILIFSTSVTWLHVMSQMQWAPSSHIYLWTNSLCVSHKHILVHLGCHSTTKTKQGPLTH